MENVLTCVSSGVLLGDAKREWERRGERPSLELYERRHWIIPYSELALHAGAAAKRILTSLCTRRDGRPHYCMVVYEDDGRCKTLEGLASEVLPYGLRESP